MPGLDEVSRELGRLSGLMEGHGRELKGVKNDIAEVKIKVDDLSINGCTKGNTHTDRVDKLEKKVERVEAGRLTGKDLLKLLGGATGITAIFTAVTEFIRHLGSK